MTTDLCSRCHEIYTDCQCGIYTSAKKPGRITARVLWRAACATQRNQLGAGITAPRLTCGVIRPEGIERYISTGRVK